MDESFGGEGSEPQWKRSLINNKGEENHCGDDSYRKHSNPSDMFSSMFPENLRILVFDEDPQYSSELTTYLLNFQYKVTSCMDEKKAMDLLRDQKIMIDIAIIDVQNSDGDRFRSISEIVSERDLPIIVTSENDSLESIAKWMTSGVCDYLTKPIQPEDLRCIFKHVVKKTQVKSNQVFVTSTLKIEDKVTTTSAEKLSYAEDSTIKNSNKKKREDQEHDYNVRDLTNKKRRVVWDDELHQKFVAVVEYLGGIDKAVPKKILERMNDAGMTRENVASHLQKYRITLKKENDKKERESKRNQSLVIPREGKMYDEEITMNNYSTQVPTNHSINNIPHQCSHMQQWQPNKNPNEFISSTLQHYHDHVDPVVVNDNLLMPHQHDHRHHHRNSDFPCIDSDDGSLVYNNFEDEFGVENLTRSFTQNLEDEMRLPFEDPTTTMIPSDHHHGYASHGINPPHMIGSGNENVEPPMVHLPQTLVYDRFPTRPNLYQKTPQEDGGSKWRNQLNR